jgi:hypothetical protein
MLEFLDSKPSDRKYRLFACACYRRVIEAEQLCAVPLPDSAVFRMVGGALTAFKNFANRFPGSHLVRYRKALQASEEYADHQISRERLSTLVKQELGEFEISQDWVIALACTPGPMPPSEAALEIARGVAGSILEQEEPNQAILTRDVFGNPFRNMTLSSAWQTSTAVSLAKAIYSDRAFDRMPILADALEDAGCDDAAILEHCRGPNVHVRGCWVVDLILGKS